jgi:beta-glucosidase-like glycosyl hydrolase
VVSIRSCCRVFIYESVLPQSYPTQAWQVAKVLRACLCGSVLPNVKPCSVPHMDFCNTSKSISERAADLVSKLTITEKIRQLSTYSFAKKYTHRFTPPVDRIGLPGYSYHTEGLHGLRDSYIGSLNATMYPQVTAMAATANATLIHEMAHVMGIEARAVHNVYMDYLFSGGRGGNCTPSTGKCTGNNTEIGTRGGFLSIYGPTMNIIRDPRWGRAQESVSGMDPRLQ